MVKWRGMNYRKSSTKTQSIDGMLMPNKKATVDNPTNVEDESNFHDQDNQANYLGHIEDSMPGLAGINMDMSEPKSKRRLSFSYKKFLKRFALICLAAFLVSGAWLGLKGYSTLKKVFNGEGQGAIAFNSEVSPEDLNSEGDGRINILILGKGGEGHDGGQLADTLIIGSVDPRGKTAALLSIPRDLYVSVDGFWQMKINAVYANAKARAIQEGSSQDQAESIGLKKIEDVVSDYFGVPIHYHVMVDFTAFSQAVDAVGGVEVEVNKALYDGTMSPPLRVESGTQQFDGDLALRYARSRYTSPRGDFDRAERQRELIVGLQKKVLSLGTFSNPLRVAQLMDALSDNVVTNLSLGEAMALYDLGEQIGPDRIASLSLVDDPVLLTTGNIGGASVVYPVAGINNYDEIKSYVRNSLRDGFINEEDASIVILNGSEKQGLASDVSDELSAYGYNITRFENAVAQYDTTTIYDISQQKSFTRAYLENRFNLTTNNSGIPEGELDYQADFVIILGSDYEAKNVSQ